jgi:dihydrolipoamide dehydrogenase
MAKIEINAELVVLGAGPGGVAAAFRASDEYRKSNQTDKKVVLINKYPDIGGVCLNVGCIPSKALLHIAEVINSNKEMAEQGLDLGANNKLDKKAILKWKDSIVTKLNQGLAGLAKQRGVELVTGSGEFSSANEIVVKDGKDTKIIKFKNVVIATGSAPVKLPFIPEDKRIFDSTGALQLANPTGKLVVLGGGIIGCEMATVYNALGAEVIIVELLDQIMPGADKDIVAPCAKIMNGRGIKTLLKTKVTAVEALKSGLKVTVVDTDGNESIIDCEQMLVAVGRVPNCKGIGIDKTNVALDDKGFIKADKYLRTNVPHIYAIGDVIGQPMLAHKATAEGRVAAEIITGHRVNFGAICIPSVSYTDPEVAWVGVTEQEAKAQGLNYKVAVFPWMACGRSLCQGRSEGKTKIIADKETGVILGAAIVGKVAGDLIAEFAFAIEMRANIEDLALTIHPHPSLAETSMMAAEVWEGTVTDLMPPRT